MLAPPPGSWRPLLGEILDPPLLTVIPYGYIYGKFVGFFLKSYNYHPQRSCGKVMFLHLSVILFTGGMSVPACITLCPGGVSDKGVSVQGVSVQGSLSRRVSVRETPLDSDPHMVTSRQYASYWNAFLFPINMPQKVRWANVYGWRGDLMGILHQIWVSFLFG